MDAPDDRPRTDADPSPEEDFSPPPPRRARRADRSLVKGTVVTIVAVAGVAALWIWFTSDDGEGEGAPSDEAPVQATEIRPPAEASGGSVPELDLPALSASDEFVRRVAAELSSRPAWAEWLATEDAVRTFVASVARVAAGSSPTEGLDFMEPEEPFQVVESQGSLVIDPASYDRYDLPAAVVASLDTEGTARLYRQLLPLFREAHRELGFEEGTFERTFADALRTLVSVEVPEGPIEVVDEDGVYLFRDPALEGLPSPAKHLIRMGPENARRVQAKLRELARELEIPVGGGGSSG